MSITSTIPAWRLVALMVTLPIGFPAVAAEPQAEELMRRAFANRYEVDTTATIELTMRNPSGRSHRRIFEAASKMIDGRLHSIGRLTQPNYLRGMTIMTIEAAERSHDAFVYLPSSGRSRRITTAQRGDSFFGTDVTYEDLERRQASEYELVGVEVSTIATEPAWQVEGRSISDFSYARIVFVVARADDAILETRFYKTGAPEPYRVIRAPRKHMIERDGHVLPTRMQIENRQRNTTTEVVFRGLQVNPSIDDELFSVRTLEAKGKLPVEHAPDE